MDMYEESWSPPEGDSIALLPMPVALLPAPVCTDTQTRDHEAAIVPSTVNWTFKARGDIYRALRDHQQSASKILWGLHIFVPPLVQRFFHDRLPMPTLSCESEPL